MTLNDPKEILQACNDFYAELYANREKDMFPIEEVEQLIDQLDHPRLSDVARDQLETQLSEEEMKKALKQLNSNKSPGTDGLPPEFYTRFWEFLSPFLLRSFQHSLARGSLSVEQRRGVVTLILKREVDRRLI